MLLNNKRLRAVGSLCTALAAVSGLLLGFAPSTRAQISGPSPAGVSVPHVGIFCVNSLGSDVVCQFGSGSGGAVTAVSGAFVDGAIATIGTESDSAWSGTGAATEMAVLKAIWTKLSGSLSVGNFPATQPVSAASLPLPAGAATSANQTLTQAPVAPASGTATKSDLIGCIAYVSPPSFTVGQQGAASCDLFGRLYASVAGTIYLTGNGNAGVNTVRYINGANSSLSTNVKTTQGALYSVDVCNSNMAAVYFRLFNLATAPTVGTSSVSFGPFLVGAGTCYSYRHGLGLKMTTGIAFDVTTGSMADTDTSTITTANTVSVSLAYQ